MSTLLQDILSQSLNWLRTTYDPSAIWAAYSVMMIGYLGWFVLERIFPAEQNQKLRGVARNMAATFVGLAINRTTNYLTGTLAVFIGHKMGGPLANVDFNAVVGSQGSVARYLLLVPALLFPLFIFDFFYYWYHRLQHLNPHLWQVHVLHHSDTSVNFSTNLRHHWLEEDLRAFFILLPLAFLVKITPAEGGFIAVVLGQFGAFIHANVRLSMGPCTPVISGPQYHRIHHSLERHHRDCNFAAFFPVWDIIFGTYYRPKKAEWPRTGVDGDDGNLGIAQLLFGPFVGVYSLIKRKTSIAFPTVSDLRIAPGLRILAMITAGALVVAGLLLGNPSIFAHGSSASFDDPRPIAGASTNER